MEIELIDAMGRYTQKSKTFLYPLLNLKVKPIETYLKFENIDTSHEKQLIALYFSKDPDYIKHKKTIESCKFYDYTFIDDVFHIVTFSLFKYAKEYDKIVKGDYSKTSDNFKSVIRETSSNEVIIKCLYPEKHYVEFAEALSCDPDILKDKELLSPPQDSAEILHVTKVIKKEIEDFYL